MQRIIVAVQFLVYAVIAEQRFPPLDALRPQSLPSAQESAVKLLLQRLIPLQANQFQIKVKSSSQLENGYVAVDADGNGMIKVTGNSGVDVAYGVQQYLRSCCNAHFSWDGNQLASIPRKLPLPKQQMTFSSVGKLRYFGNICTFSYSFVWWKWEQWEPFIDWLALSGFNLILAPIGQEYVWKNVFLDLGMTQAEIDDHFAGPAFLSWFRMGNLKKWAGPLSEHWLTEQRDLQKQMLDRMISLGMVPVLPTFPGHVPTSIKRLFPSAKISSVGCWGAWNATYSCLDFLDPLDPLFARISSSFMQKQNETYGLTHAYAADPFNEMAPTSFNESYLADVARAIYMGAASTDPDAVWIMQNWYLVMNVGKLWTSATAKAYLQGVPEGRVIVLDLRSEEWPQYNLFSSYFGQPFIWNLLHNFGGVNDLRGSFDAVNTGLSKAVSYPNGTMVGVGLTMEGIYQNYVQYQFLIDRTWSTTELSKEKWILEYSINRYGQHDDLTASAWSLLQTSVYSEPIPAVKQINFEDNTASLKIAWFESYLFDRPQLQKPLEIWYNPKYLCQAWGLLIKRIDQFRNNSLFKHDVIDLTREALQLIATKSLVPSITVAFNKSSIALVKGNGTALDTLLADMDQILGFDKELSVQNWISLARAKGGSVPEEKQFEFNARNQVTLWGPSGQGLDYAKKQWAGLINQYYRPRWALFVARLVNSISTKEPFSQGDFNANVLELIEKPFANAPIEPASRGDWTSVARQLFGRYYTTCSQLKQ